MLNEYSLRKRIVFENSLSFPPLIAQQRVFMKKSFSKVGLFVLLLVQVNCISAQCGPGNAPIDEIGIRLGSLTNASNFGGKFHF